MMNNSKKLIIFILVFVLVFGSTMFCFHNVGLCAEPSSVYLGSSLGGLPNYTNNSIMQYTIDTITDDLINNYPFIYNVDYNTIYFARVRYSYDSYKPYITVYVGDKFNPPTFGFDFASNFVYSDYVFLNPNYEYSIYMYWSGLRAVHYDLDSLTYLGWDNGNSMYFQARSEPSTVTILGSDVEYPLYSNLFCYATIPIESQFGSIVEPYVTQEPTFSLNGDVFGHSSGIGSALQNGFDIGVDNLIVDTSTSDLKWYQKIFNRLGLINNNIVNGFTDLYNALGGLFSPFFSQVDTFTSNIVNSLESGFGDVLEALVNSIDSDLSFINDFLAWFTEPLDLSSLPLSSIPFYDSITVVIDYTSQFKSSLSNIPEYDNLSFTIPYNILTVQDNIVLDFSWYKDIKSKYLNVLLTFLYFGFFFVFVRALPGVFGGASATVDLLKTEKGKNKK